MTLAEAMKQAMEDTGVGPTDLARALVLFRGQDPEDRRSWDAARQAVARWRNGRSKRIDDPDELEFVAGRLQKPVEWFQPSPTPPSALFVVLERLVSQLREDETALQDHPEEAAEAIAALRQVSDVTARFAEALEAALEALPGDTQADAQ